MKDLRTCELCGHQGLDVEIQLARYRDGREPHASVDRCIDRAACRRRVEARGESWPLQDPAR